MRFRLLLVRLREFWRRSGEAAPEVRRGLLRLNDVRLDTDGNDVWRRSGEVAPELRRALFRFNDERGVTNDDEAFERADRNDDDEF